MIVQFHMTMLYPNKTNVDYIVTGVGESIKLVPKVSNFNTRFSSAETSLYNTNATSNAKTTAKVQIDPNNSNYIFLGGTTDWSNSSADANIVSPKDYMSVLRGSKNINIWSRVNFWYHRDNFIDAGDAVTMRITCR